MGEVKIEFGCGETPTKKDFKTCDVRNLRGIDFVCNAWEIDSLVEHNTVDEIYSRHFLEHLTFIQVDKYLKSCMNILKSNSIFECEVPNMDFHIQQWIEGKEMKHAIAGFWGWQREGMFNTWDIHKSGYNFKLLKEKLLQHGFINVQQLESKPQNLSVIAYKP